ncbi:MAG: hypothetical protein PHE86_00530 [Candidatus Marinimicrobia bacterium]|nr:hypothetical protein [Candidatus Neomarinimicrobiota bacterium]MDD5582044.1 hypothetical protein [Candidatus Neomarinimicrobiota bacterium]
MKVPRPGKYVINEGDEDKQFDFTKYRRRHKSPRTLWGSLIMLIILIVVYFFLQSLIK